MADTGHKTTTEEWDSIGSYLPNLDRSKCWTTGPWDQSYNCYAWTLGITNEDINPDTSNLKRKPSREDVKRFYDAQGFVECGADEATIDIWANAKYVTHAAKFIGGDYAESKLGANIRIRHPRTELRGEGSDQYGAMVMHFKPRPKQ